MEITATRIEEKIIGHKCDVCEVLIDNNCYSRLIQETPDEWIQTDLCQVDYNTVMGFIRNLKGVRAVVEYQKSLEVPK